MYMWPLHVAFDYWFFHVILFIYPCSHPVPSQVLHITVNDELLQPFLNSKAERMFESDGNNQLVNGISTGLYSNQTLLLGTMFTGMMVCTVTHTIY